MLSYYKSEADYKRKPWKKLNELLMMAQYNVEEHVGHKNNFCLRLKGHRKVHFQCNSEEER